MGNKKYFERCREISDELIGLDRDALKKIIGSYKKNIIKRVIIGIDWIERFDITKKYNTACRFLGGEISKDPYHRYPEQTSKEGEQGLPDINYERF